jgi:DNA repair exonuclease SbcCD nuclease subunit
MELEEKENKEQNQIKNKTEKNENPEVEKNEDEYVKVTISKKAEKTVTDLLARVNDGYEGGRINRQNLISWIVATFSDECTDQEIRTIRADHFDEIMLLELSLKKFKQAGALPPELRKLLMAQAGLDEVNKKSAKKSLT